MHEELFIGEGVLEWPPQERETGRYGVITLWDGTGKDAKRVILKRKLTRYGELWAMVTEARKPTHVGDPDRNLVPKAPERGNKFLIGEGILMYPDIRSIALQLISPDKFPWMNVGNLYRVINQTVKVYFQ
jgi:hypothetical protein